MNDSNANLTFEPDAGLILEKNEAENQGIPLFSAHWCIFAPTLIIFFAYSFSWLLLAYINMTDTNLARLFIVVMSVFVPLLAAYAFLRYQTIRLQVNEDRIVCHPGWPKDLPIEIPFSMVEKITVKQSLFGKIFGGGTLVLHLVEETKVSIADLSNYETAKLAIFEALSKKIS